MAGMVSESPPTNYNQPQKGNTMKNLIATIAMIAIASTAHAGNLVTEGLDDPHIAEPRGSSILAPFKFRSVGDVSTPTVQYYYPDNVASPKPRPTPPAAATPPTDGPTPPSDDGPKQGCNGSKCAPDSGGGNSEGNEQSDNDND